MAKAATIVLDTKRAAEAKIKSLKQASVLTKKLKTKLDY